MIYILVLIACIKDIFEEIKMYDSHVKKGVLEEREKGKYFWNPVEGVSYTLSYDGGFFSGSRTAKGVFIGKYKGRFVFIKKEGDELFGYTADPGAPAVWLGDAGDDEPCFPAVYVCFQGAVKNERDRAFALNRLEELVRG